MSKTSLQQLAFGFFKRIKENRHQKIANKTQIESW